MTLGEFFNYCSENPTNLIVFFTGLPVLALLALIFGKDEGHLSPWRYLYSGLVYLSSLPGIFAVTLSIYMFFFERGSILNANMYTQILPILSMILTLWLIRRNVDFDSVPGFDKIGSLIFFMTILILILWILEKTNILVITFMPFGQFLLFLIVVLVVLRFVLKRIFG